MDEIKDPRGKHLLGEAVRLLVQSGVTGGAITDFIQGYAPVVHATLASPPEPPNDIKKQLKEALTEALQELAPPKKRGPNALRKVVSVYIDGARTTMAVRRDLLESTAAAVGGDRNARRLIEDLANTKPQDHPNRTGWVEAQLQHRLVLLKAEANLTGAAPH